MTADTTPEPDGTESTALWSRTCEAAARLAAASDSHRGGYFLGLAYVAVNLGTSPYGTTLEHVAANALNHPPFGEDDDRIGAYRQAITELVDTVRRTDGELLRDGEPIELAAQEAKIGYVPSDEEARRLWALEAVSWMTDDTKGVLGSTRSRTPEQLRLAEWLLERPADAGTGSLKMLVQRTGAHEADAPRCAAGVGGGEFCSLREGHDGDHRP